MSDWINAAIAAGAALGASGLTGLITLRAARRVADAQRGSDLLAALQAYGYAADRLYLEISQLPPAPGRLAVAVQAGAARLGALDWSAGQIARHTLGRPAMRALDTYMAAFNRLVLVAPEPILTGVQPLNDLIARLDKRDEKWSTEWSDARGDLTKTARLAVGHAKRQLLPRRVPSR
jgi:hypothetical protein